MKQIKVGPYYYDVHPAAIVLHEEEPVYAKIDLQQHIIDISTKYHPARQKAAILHEVIHAIDDLFAIDLSEEQVRKLGNGLYTVLTDNSFLSIPDIEKKQRIKKA